MLCLCAKACRFLERKAQAQKAALEARGVITMPVRDYGHLRIWQWGSLLDRARFSEISDIDKELPGRYRERLDPSSSNGYLMTKSRPGKDENPPRHLCAHMVVVGS